MILSGLFQLSHLVILLIGGTQSVVVTGDPEEVYREG